MMLNKYYVIVYGFKNYVIVFKKTSRAGSTHSGGWGTRKIEYRFHAARQKHAPCVESTVNRRTNTTMECIGCVQKRVGSRLRKLKNVSKGVKLSDGKGLGCKGKLTDGKIDVLQNYYGLAVRENLDDVNKMAKAIKAVVYHVASTDSNPQHHLCPDGDDSWCGYKRDKKSYKHKNCIPKCIVEIIEPVSDDLSNPDLLQKCTHSMTQNVNECLDGLIWDRCPKTTYVEQEQELFHWQLI